jgi:hypothetical protein
MADLASAYRDQGKYREAEEIELKVMDMRKKVLRNDHQIP